MIDTGTPVLDGRFRVLKLLGAGGMGEVYLGEQVSLGRKVAIKVLHPDLMLHSSMVERFKREARLLSALDHPAVVRVIDFGQTQVGACLVMEYVEGENLYDLLQTGAMAPARALPLLYQLAEGLAAIHDKGIIHRDLKPENVLLTRGPRGEQARLLDFGIARMVEQESDGGLSQVGLVVGTPEYLSPEQAVGAPVDTRSDVYSFGVLAYRVLSGQLPFRGPGPTQYVAQHASAAPLPLIEAAPTLAGHPALVALVMQLLRKDPANRLPHATALVEALGTLVTSPTSMDAPPPALTPGSSFAEFAASPASAPPSSGTVAFAVPPPASAAEPAASPPSGTAAFAVPGVAAPSSSPSQAPTRVSPGRAVSGSTLSPSRAATLPSVGHVRTVPQAPPSRPPTPAPAPVGSGTLSGSKPQNVTVMLTDLRGYTERASRQTHEQNARMLETHEALLVPPVRDFGGRLVHKRGEALLAVFPSPTQAVLCGKAMQDRLWRHNQLCPTEEQLPVRISLHTGEVLVTRDAVLGEPMEVVKAVEQVAEAGEVVFTGSVNLARNRVEGDAEPCGSVPIPGSGEPLPLFRCRRAESGPPFGGEAALAPRPTLSQRLGRVLAPVRARPRLTLGLGVGLLVVLGLGTGWVIRRNDPIRQVRGLVEAGRLDDAWKRLNTLPPEVKRDAEAKQLRARVLHTWNGHDSELQALLDLEPGARSTLEPILLDGLAEDFGRKEERADFNTFMASLPRDQVKERFESLAREEPSLRQWGALRYLEAMQATEGLDLVKLYSQALEVKQYTGAPADRTCAIRARAAQRLAGLGNADAVPALERVSKLPPRPRCGQDEAKAALETLTRK